MHVNRHNSKRFFKKSINKSIIYLKNTNPAHCLSLIA